MKLHWIATYPQSCIKFHFKKLAKNPFLKKWHLIATCTQSCIKLYFKKLAKNPFFKKNYNFYTKLH